MTRPLTYRQALEHAARRYWAKTLAAAGGSVTQAARIAHVNRTAAYKQFARFGIVLNPRPTHQLYGRRGFFQDVEQHGEG